MVASPSWCVWSLLSTVIICTTLPTPWKSATSTALGSSWSMAPTPTAVPVPTSLLYMCWILLLQVRNFWHRLPWQGAFTIYIDQFSEFLDPSLPIGRPFIYWGLFSKVDIRLTPPSLSLVYVECECPHMRQTRVLNGSKKVLLRGQSIRANLIF